MSEDQPISELPEIKEMTCARFESLPKLLELPANKREFVTTKRRMTGRISKKYSSHVMNHLKHNGIIDILENKEIVIPYNKNMVRKTNPPAKTFKEQDQRLKSNMASRKSRMKNYMLEEALEQEARRVDQENRRLKMSIAGKRVLVNLLCKHLGYGKLNLGDEWEKEQNMLDDMPEDYAMSLKYKLEVERMKEIPDLIPIGLGSSTAREMISSKRIMSSRISQQCSPNVLYHLHQTGIMYQLKNAELVVPYNEKMVRKRKPEPTFQYQRAKNNLSSRVSRLKQKMLDDALEIEAEKLDQENRRLKMKIAQNRTFVNELLELIGHGRVNMAKEWESAQEISESSESETDD